LDSCSISRWQPSTQIAYFAVKMKWLFLIFIPLAACTDNSTGPKAPLEIDHTEELSFRVDTTISEVPVSYRIEPVPNYYVISSVQTDTSVEAHIYKDQRIVVKINNDSFVVTKDSLERDINDAFRNNAVLDHLKPMVLDPVNREYLFEYGLRKPLEEFFYRYELLYTNGVWVNYIADK